MDIKEARKYHREYGRRMRAATLALLGNVCENCGFDDYRALQVDHINGGGTKERKKSAAARALFKNVQENPENYQLLCANCNWIKRFELGEHRPLIN